MSASNAPEPQSHLTKSNNHIDIAVGATALLACLGLLAGCLFGDPKADIKSDINVISGCDIEMVTENGRTVTRYICSKDVDASGPTGSAVPADASDYAGYFADSSIVDPDATVAYQDGSTASDAATADLPICNSPKLTLYNNLDDEKYCCYVPFNEATGMCPPETKSNMPRYDIPTGTHYWCLVDVDHCPPGFQLYFYSDTTPTAVYCRRLPGY